MKPSSILLSAAALLLATPGLAQDASRASDAADKFSLDLPAVEPDTDVTAPEATAPEAPPAPPAARPRKAAKAKFTLDTPITKLMADYRSKAVLDRDMPGLTVDKNIDKFKTMSLTRLAPLSGGRLSPELLERVGADLAAID